MDSGQPSPQKKEKKVTTKLSVYQARQINGCLVKTPTNFYEDCWFVLQRCRAGIKINGNLLPQAGALSCAPPLLLEQIIK